jgi:twitching motility two-component system response regulator PilH
MASILIIEDHPDTLYMLMRIMKQFGHRAMSAETGEAGMAVLVSDRPDIIIVDGMMPGMNGTEFIRLCRANPATATIPIILNTAIGDSTFTDDAVHKGANEVWIKGEVTVEQMRERLDRYLKTGGGEKIA